MMMKNNDNNWLFQCNFIADNKSLRNSCANDYARREKQTDPYQVVKVLGQKEHANPGTEKI